MAKKFNQTVLTFACVAALAAAQIAPVAVPVFGYASVKAESPAEEIVAVVVKGVDDSGELLSGPAVTIHPESKSYTVVAEDIEGYTPVSYLVLAQSFLWETRGSGNEVTFSHQDAFSRGETMVDVVFSYIQNELPPKSPEDSPIADQGGGPQDGSNNGSTNTSIEPPSSEETPGLTPDTNIPPSNEGDDRGNIPPAPNPNNEQTLPKEEVTPPKSENLTSEAPKGNQPQIYTEEDDSTPSRTTPDTLKTPQDQGDQSTSSPQEDSGKDRVIVGNPEAGKVTATPEVRTTAATPINATSVTPAQEASKKTLPNTGDSSLVGVALSGIGGLISTASLFSLRRKD